MALPELILGSFNLTDWAGSVYGVSVIAEGTSKGAPAPIEVAVKSWLQDGAVVVTQGYDNRTVTLRVRLRGPDLVAVTDAEAALFAELGKPNTLTWTPGDGLSPSSVFVVVTSSMEHAPSADEDIAEGLSFPWRTYNVRLVCKAFVRSATPFSSIALPPTGGTTTTNLDTCGVTTGWTATVNGVAATVVNAAGPPTTNSVVATTGYGLQILDILKTFAATTTTLKYLVIDWKQVASNPASSSIPSLVAIGDGVTLTRIAEAAAPTSGYVRTWFYIAAASLAALKLEWGWRVLAPMSMTISVDNVAITDVLPGAGTNRQQLRSLDVPGSARTPGSLSVESSSAALGDTMVYVYPADDSTVGYTPSLRQFRASGNTVIPDSNQVSGNTESLTPAVTFNVPVGLFPVGSYLLLGRLATSGGGTPTILATGKTIIGTTAVASDVLSAEVTTTTTYQIFVLGRMQLPTIDLDPGAGTTAQMSLTVESSAACTYDEFWLFNTTIGRLIRVDCGTGAGTVGGSSRRLFIEPATVTTPRPTLRIGHSADRSDSHYPAGAFPSWQPPEFVPPKVNALVVTPNATDATIKLSGYAQWHTNPGA